MLKKCFALESKAVTSHRSPKNCKTRTKADHITRVARQTACGRWTSKLGSDVDIEHELQSIAGEVYGSAAQMLKRPLAEQS
jgi:hypothetical protein